MLAAAAACGTGEASDRALTAAERAPAPGATSELYARKSPPTHVDSIFPVEEALRRFRAAVGPEPAGLEGGAASRHALLDRFAQALAAHDTVAFAGMVMSAAEFGWLYYPHTRYMVASLPAGTRSGLAPDSKRLEPRARKAAEPPGWDGAPRA
jgi:hypothetical protein